MISRTIQQAIAKIAPLRDLLDAMGEWEPDPTDAEPEAQRLEMDPEIVTVPVPAVVDMEADAARVRYPDRRNKAGQVTRRGAIKRTRYAPRDLSAIEAVVVHQMGVERAASSSRWRFVTCNRLVRTDGARVFVHPLACRVMGANAFDRPPYCAANIEVAGNFEGVDGSGEWYKPAVFGAGRASTLQLVALGWEIRAIRDDVGAAGGQLRMVAPHRVSGRDSRGAPNRPICPGSRLWQAAETVALALGLGVPPDGWDLGGLSIPQEWRSLAWWELNGAEPPAGWRDALTGHERALLESLAP